MVEAPLRVASVAISSPPQSVGLVLKSEDFPPFKEADVGVSSVDAQIHSKAKVVAPLLQPSSVPAARDGGKVLVGGLVRTPSSRLLPNIHMADEPEPLSSPPSFHNLWAGGKSAPKSFAMITRESHVRPMFDEIAMRDPVQVDGKSMMVFSPMEVGKLSAPFAWTLVGKFAAARPTLMQIWNIMRRVRNFSKGICVSAVDQQYVFIRFHCREDFVKAYIKRDWRVGGKVMQVSRWSPRFTPGVESPCIPVWIELPRLRAHLQSPGALQSIAGMVGKFLCADGNVAQFTRPGTTRVCVEVDLSKPIPRSVWINNGGEIFSQQVEFPKESIPPFCKKCMAIGHVGSTCQLSSRASGGYESSKDWVEKTFYSDKEGGISSAGGTEVVKNKAKKKNKKSKKNVQFVMRSDIQ